MSKLNRDEVLFIWRGTAEISESEMFLDRVVRWDIAGFGVCCVSCSSGTGGDVEEADRDGA